MNILRQLHIPDNCIEINGGTQTLMDISTLLLTALEFGVLFALLAVLFERILIFAGLTRGNTLGLAVVAFFLTAFYKVLDYRGFPYAYGLFIVLIGPIVANRYDLTNTFSKGRWWWKSENDSKDC
ncbi:MAG TPA: hypothetical protein VGK00_10875 [Anaerolineales bacterium]